MYAAATSSVLCAALEASPVLVNPVSGYFNCIRHIRISRSGVCLQTCAVAVFINLGHLSRASEVIKNANAVHARSLIAAGKGNPPLSLFTLLLLLEIGKEQPAHNDVASQPHGRALDEQINRPCGPFCSFYCKTYHTPFMKLL